MLIWNGYLAREHLDAEYKYRAVFVAIINHQARRRDLNNIYTVNTFIAYLYSLLYCLPRHIPHTSKPTGLVYSLVFRLLLPPSHYIVILNVTETNEQYQYAHPLKPTRIPLHQKTRETTRRSYPTISRNILEQVLLAETRQEPFTETFYRWVNTTLYTQDLEALYSYLEDEYFQYEPPSTEDYEAEWTEISTQKSRRLWSGIEDQEIRP